MESFYAWIAGVIFGSFVSWLILRHWKVVNGYFRVNPVDKDEGTYGVSISINHKQDLVKARTIVLTRDDSQQ